MTNSVMEKTPASRAGMDAFRSALATPPLETSLMAVALSPLAPFPFPALGASSAMAGGAVAAVGALFGAVA